MKEQRQYNSTIISHKLIKIKRLHAETGMTFDEVFPLVVGIETSSDCTIAKSIVQKLTSHYKTISSRKKNAIERLQSDLNYRENVYNSAIAKRLSRHADLVRYRKELKGAISESSKEKIQQHIDIAMRDIKVIKTIEQKHLNLLTQIKKQMSELIAQCEHAIQELLSVKTIHKWIETHKKIAIDYAIDHGIDGRFTSTDMHMRRCEHWFEPAESVDKREADRDREIVIKFTPDAYLLSKRRKARNFRLYGLSQVKDDADDDNVSETGIKSYLLLNALWAWERRFKFNDPERVAVMVQQVRYADGSLYLLVDATKFPLVGDCNISTVGIAMNIDYDLMTIDLKHQTMPAGKLLYDRSRQLAPLFTMSEDMLSQCPDEIKARKLAEQRDKKKHY